MKYNDFPSIVSRSAYSERKTDEISGKNATHSLSVLHLTVFLEDKAP